MSVQNMHLMTTSLEQVGGYWSSFNWCKSARDSQGRFMAPYDGFLSWQQDRIANFGPFGNFFFALFWSALKKPSLDNNFLHICWNHMWKWLLKDMGKIFWVFHNNKTTVFPRNEAEVFQWLTSGSRGQSFGGIRSWKISWRQTVSFNKNRCSFKNCYA